MQASKDIAELAKQALAKMHAPISIKGYAYIIEAIKIIDDTISIELNQENVYDIKISFVYSIIATRFKTTVSAIERDIRHAFEIIRSRAAGTDRSFEVDRYLGTIEANKETLCYFHSVIKNEYADSKIACDDMPKTKDELRRFIEQVIDDYNLFS